VKLAAIALALGAVPALASAADPAAAARPEARPFGNPDAASKDVDAALIAAAATGKHVILVFGANWCHDSRALAGWFATPRFAAMLRDRYEIVWINVGDNLGEKDRNGDLARRFGLGPITKTPTVLIVDGEGKPLNLADAPSWANASTRSEDAIFRYFAKQ
jgi:thioredoxin-related protein